MTNPSKSTLKTRSKSLRKRSTKAEKFLWQLLRDRRLSKFKFRRQHVIAPFIVDFVCLKQKLIIELEGGYHKNRVGYDNWRTRYLMARGFRVVRFDNERVLGGVEELEGVLGEVLGALSLPSPRPSPAATD